HVTKARQRQPQADVKVFISVPYLPRFRHTGFAGPTAFHLVGDTVAVFLLADKSSVGASPPLLFRQHLPPDSLRSGPYQNIRAKAVALLASTGGEPSIILPRFREMQRHVA